MRTILFCILLVLFGCGPRLQLVRYRYQDGSLHKMRLEERNLYEAQKRDIESQYEQAKASGEEEVVILTRVCESFDQRIQGLREETHPELTSARVLMEKDKAKICGKAEEKRRRLEAKQLREKDAAERQRHYEESRKEREAYQEAEQQGTYGDGPRKFGS
jgi:hypothetical protein